MTLRERLDSPVLVAALVLVLYGYFTHSLWLQRNRDISIFVVAGGGLVDPARVEPGLTVIPNIGGYDGEFFYRLALGPFTREQTKHGVTLDNPSYRQQRIGYPLIAWLLSGGGRPRAVPFVLVLVNILAAAAVGVAGAILARQFGVHAAWGLAFALYPGFLLTLSRDTAEIVTCAFALGGLAALGARRRILATALLSYAVLTRETALLVVLGIAGAWLLRLPLWRRFYSASHASSETESEPHEGSRAFVWIVPIVVYVIWQIVLRSWWNVAPVHAGRPAWGVPFADYVRFFEAAVPRRTRQQRVYFYECTLLALFVIASAIAAVRGRGRLAWKLTWIAELVLASTLPHNIWLEDYGFLRIFADLFVMGAALIVAMRSTAFRAFCLIVTAATWWYVARVMLNL